MSTITRILGRMEKDHLVRKQLRADDNRVVEVFITKSGLALLGGLKAVASDVFAAAFEGMPETEIAAFVAALKTVRENLTKPRFAQD